MKITWYGHNCYRIENDGISFLIDPYDQFRSIDLGVIPADYLLMSSTWHDHGNIAASPKAHVIHEPGFQKLNGFKVWGIEGKEGRGSSTIIHCVQFDDGVCFTNFGDWGDRDGLARLSERERSILAGTDIAFARFNSVDNKNNLRCFDLAYQASAPKIIIPTHYFPISFFNKYPPQPQKQDDRYGKVFGLNHMQRRMRGLGYALYWVDSHTFGFSLANLRKENMMVTFNYIHPQVKRVDSKVA